ncbi:uncharacterized protein ACNLHF_000599 [Anomaloglossus baeobatrachus]|uniref:uncharacterized protein LOC142251156 n=1 Tax=Anomaloglossus baeobatrachus TaxID=238106 RepID=UPI003F4FD358
MKKEKKNFTERILNHALGIIYLLTGEEYVIVKKNSPHRATHLLTGEVPIKCGDISIYFSMEEWDFIEEHKDLYQEVTLKNQKISHPSEILEDVTDGHEHDDSLALAEGVSGSRNSQQVEMSHKICPDVFMDRLETPLHTEKEQSENNENDIFQVEINSETYLDEYFPSQVSDERQADEHLARIREQQLHGDTWAVHPVPSEHSMERTLQEEPYNMTCSLNGSITDDLSIFHGFREEDLPTESPSYDTGNITFTLASEGRPLGSPLLTESYSHTNNDKHAGDKLVRNVRKTSERLSKLSTRTTEQHSKEKGKPHQCGDCGKYFDHKSNLIRHQRSHTGEKPYGCEECGKRYATKSHLTVHKRTHLSGKPHQCNECGKHFTYKSQIAMHQRTHTGEKPHTCNLCGKHFAYKSYLIIHQRIHSGERPHVCPQCGKCFTDKSNLRKHQNTHVQNKPYVCRECGKHFNSKNSYTTHQRTHQGGKYK